MSWGTLGTVRPFSNFHPERDAMELQSALEKKGSVASAFLGGNPALSVPHSWISNIIFPWLRHGDSGEDPDQSQQRSETTDRQDFWRSCTKGDRFSSVPLRHSEQRLDVCRVASTPLSSQCVCSSICVLIKHGLVLWWRAETPHLCLVKNQKQEWQQLHSWCCSSCY